MWKRELRHFMEAAECSAKRWWENAMRIFTDCAEWNVLSAVMMSVCNASDELHGTEMNQSKLIEK